MYESTLNDIFAKKNIKHDKYMIIKKRIIHFFQNLEFAQKQQIYPILLLIFMFVHFTSSL